MSDERHVVGIEAAPIRLHAVNLVVREAPVRLRVVDGYGGHVLALTARNCARQTPVGAWMLCKECPNGMSAPLPTCRARRSRRKMAGPSVYFRAPSWGFRMRGGCGQGAVSWIIDRKTMAEKPDLEFGMAGPSALTTDTGKPFTLGKPAQAAAAPRCCLGIPTAMQQRTPSSALTCRAKLTIARGSRHGVDHGPQQQLPSFL